jgi:hypothetical protein
LIIGSTRYPNEPLCDRPNHSNTFARSRYMHATWPRQTNDTNAIDYDYRFCRHGIAADCLRRCTTSSTRVEDGIHVILGFASLCEERSSCASRSILSPNFFTGNVEKMRSISTRVNALLLTSGCFCNSRLGFLQADVPEQASGNLFASKYARCRTLKALAQPEAAF